MPPFPSSAFVSLVSGVCDTPLQDSESVPARLAPEGINVKEAHQTFKTIPSGSSDIVAGTLGTTNLSADFALRSHSGRKIARKKLALSVPVSSNQPFKWRTQ